MKSKEINKNYVYLNSVALGLGYANFGCFIVQIRMIGAFEIKKELYGFEFCTYIGAMLGTFLAGCLISQKRRLMIVVGNLLIFFMVFMLIPLFFPNIPMILGLLEFLRVMQGVGIGFLMINVPLYLKDKMPKEMASSVLVFNFLHYYAALLINRIILIIFREESQFTAAICMISFSVALALAQIILCLANVINDTPKELHMNFMTETAISELVKIYPDATRRLEEFGRLQNTMVSLRYSSPGYCQLFSSIHRKKTFQGLFLAYIWGINRLVLIKGLSVSSEGMNQSDFTAIIGAAEFLGVLIAFWRIESYNRRLGFSIGSVLSLVLSIAIIVVAVLVSNGILDGNFLYIMAPLALNFGLFVTTLSYLHMVYALPNRGFATSMIFYFFIITMGEIIFQFANLDTCELFIVFCSIIIVNSIVLFFVSRMVMKDDELDYVDLWKTSAETEAFNQDNPLQS